ncbi:tetratricopeptide repeat protein [Candidatus Pseudothioglobus sp. Uisw_050_01]|uniref:tetratricopeptide repeat protein n=1 Tax=Candidatus Pseudothioglobus sp. Uisw_050_01 TaxID=3230997 RepID=UPI003A8B27E0
MNNTANLFNISLTKVLLLISFSILLLPQAIAEDGLYERGIELIEQKNYEKALKAFELGSKTGDLNAMTALGIMYITGVGVIQDDTKGFKYVQEAANKSHPKAQYTLGAIYYLGAGVNIDFNKAFSWISLSANQGYSDAQHNLAQMYEAGEGVSQNFEQAYEYYLKAARNDNLDSQIKVTQMYQEGIGTEKNLEKSAYWLKKIEESKVEK